MFIGVVKDLPCHTKLISSSTPGVQNNQLRVHGVHCQGVLISMPARGGEFVADRKSLRAIH